MRCSLTPTKLCPRWGRVIAKAILATLLLWELAACNGFYDPPTTKAELLREDLPVIDRAALARANAGLMRLWDPDEPVMRVPPRAGSGLVGRIELASAGTSYTGITVPAADRRVGPEGQAVEIEFVNARLRSVIEFIFNDYLKKPYTILPDFKDADVNLLMSGSFSQREILRMFEVFLDRHGVSVSETNGLFIISSRLQKADLDASTAGQTTAFWRLRFLNAQDIIPIAREFLSVPKALMIIPGVNMIVVTASGPEVRQIDNLMASIDVPYFSDTRILLYVPRYLTARALVALLQNLSRKLNVGQQAREKIVDAEIVENSNRVVIVTRDGEVEKIVRDFLHEVDRPGQNRAQVFYYPLRNERASDVSATVNAVINSLFLDAEDISIVPHGPTNSLIITATPEQYFEIRKLFARLDFTVPSVLIDTTIVEVQLNESLAYGVEWFLSKQFGDAALADVTTNLINSAATGGFFGTGATGGTTIGIISLTANQFFILDVLASETELRVLSRPRILVKNKSRAVFKSIDEIRVVQSVESSDIQVAGATGFVRTFVEKEVGVTLEVTPTIADDGTISLDIKIEDSRQGAPDFSSGEPQPTFNRREITTTLIVGHGETVFIAGLIQSTAQQDRRKIPLLGDLPLIGAAFATETDSVTRTELIIMVTPYIVFDRQAARIVSEALTGSGLLERPPRPAGTSIQQVPIQGE